MIDVTEVVFNGRDGNNVLTLTQDGSPFQSDAISRTIVQAVDGTIIADSDTNPNTLSWNGASLTMQLGSLQVAAGVYLVRVIVFDPSNGKGLPIIHEASSTRLKIKFLD